MRLILLAAVVTFVAPGLMLGQNAKHNDALEQEIRKLDLAQAEAIRLKDFQAMNSPRCKQRGIKRDRVDRPLLSCLVAERIA